MRIKPCMSSFRQKPKKQFVFVLANKRRTWHDSTIVCQAIQIELLFFVFLFCCHVFKRLSKVKGPIFLYNIFVGAMVLVKYAVEHQLFSGMRSSLDIEFHLSEKFLGFILQF